MSARAHQPNDATGGQIPTPHDTPSQFLDHRQTWCIPGSAQGINTKASSIRGSLSVTTPSNPLPGVYNVATDANVSLSSGHLGYFAGQQDITPGFGQPLQSRTHNTASVLPSPAPTDEPSPANSARQDSQEPPGAAHSFTRAGSLLRGTSRQSSPWRHGNGEGLVPQTTATAQPSASRPIDQGRSPYPNVLNLESSSMVPTSQAAQSPGGHDISFSHLSARPLSTPTGPGAPQTFTTHTSENQHKRRRLDPDPRGATDPLDLKLMTDTIDAQIHGLRRGGAGRETGDQIVIPRLQLLRDACTSGDTFYLAIHQMFCIATSTPSVACQMLQVNRNVLDSAISALQQTLKSNSELSSDRLAWFVAFPVWPLSAASERYQALISDVALFFEKLVQNWPGVLSSLKMREYPILVEELRDQLQLASPTLQTILFTQTRRLLHVTEGEFATKLLNIFKEDQASHTHQRSAEEQQFITSQRIAKYKDLIGAYRIFASAHQAAQQQLQLQAQQRAHEQGRQYAQQMQQQRIQQVLQFQPSQSQQTQQQLQQRQPLSLGTGVPPGPEATRPGAAVLPTPQQHSFYAIEQAQQASMAAATVAPAQSGPLGPGGRTQLPQLVTPSPMLRSQVPQVPQPTPGYLAGQHPGQSLQGLPATQAYSPMQPAPGLAHPILQPANQAHLTVQPQNGQATSIRRQPSEAPLQYVQGGGRTAAMQPQPQGQLRAPQLSSQLPSYTQMEGSARRSSEGQQRSGPNGPLNRSTSSQASLGVLNATPGGAAAAGSSHAVSAVNRGPMPSSQLVSPPSFEATAAFQSYHSHSHPVPPPPSRGSAIPQQGMTYASPHDESSFNPIGIRMSSVRPRPYGTTATPSPANPVRPPGTRLLPAKGHLIALENYVHDPYDRNSFFRGLHQAGSRSPRRMPQNDGVEPSGRYYQAIKHLAAGPIATPAFPGVHEFTFQVTGEDKQKLCKYEAGLGGSVPVASYVDGSLRYRLRLCELERSPDEAQAGVGLSDWVTAATHWPKNIFITFNGKGVAIRRKQLNGQHQPVELTQLVRLGENRVKVGIPGEPRNARALYMAVEVVETISHQSVLSMVWNGGVIPAEVTKADIGARLARTELSNSEEISIVETDLSVDLTDPFSSVLFDIPARGLQCKHLECFDLENWLNTRPAKPLCTVHGGGNNCSTCNRLPRTGPEPSLVDKWKCPLCDGDARPHNLRIDMFLLNIRRELLATQKQGIKKVLIAADGSWSAKTEEEVESDDEDWKMTKGKASDPTRLGGNPSDKVDFSTVEVIELD